MNLHEYMLIGVMQYFCNGFLFEQINVFIGRLCRIGKIYFEIIFDTLLITLNEILMKITLRRFAAHQIALLFLALFCTKYVKLWGPQFVLRKYWILVVEGLFCFESGEIKVKIYDILGEMIKIAFSPRHIS